MQTYGHIDADCFYVSCERLRDPFLEGKPVAVLGNQGACVIAVSYEMKAMGVQVGEPIWLSKRKCPEGLFIKRDFRWYGLLSHAMQDVLAEFSDEVEYYSVDESFVNFGRVPHEDWESLGQKIQRRMKQATGLPVSVGVSNTRTLAKLGSKRNKPEGVCVIHNQNRWELLNRTNLEQVNGIGRRLIKRCHKLGLYTAFDFADSERLFIQQHFNKPGETLWYELNGQPVLKIKPEKSQLKVVSRGGSLWGHHTDPNYIWGFLLRNLERFLTVLWSERIEIRFFTLVLKTSEGHSFQHRIELEDYTQDHSPLFEALKLCFQKSFRAGFRYCRVHLIGEKIRSCKEKQMNFWVDLQQMNRDEKTKSLRAELNQRFGLFTLRSASTAHAAAVFKDKVSDFEITDIEGKHLF